MLGLISRLREPLSDEGRASFAQATVLSGIVGLVRGFSLVSFIPAAIALTSDGPAWGMSCALLRRRVSAGHALLLGGL